MRLPWCVMLLLVLGCTATSQRPAHAPSAGKPAPAPPSPTQLANNESVKKVMAGIAGHEKEPAETVFKNVQLPQLKDVPAGTFLAIMNYGYARALGVTCTHCHVENDFASDDKRPKRAAREMAEMHREINKRLLAMKNLEQVGEQRYINCSVCHRGHIYPKGLDN